MGAATGQKIFLGRAPADGMLTTGRTLDGDGRPIPGTGFDLPPDGELADLLGRRTGAMTSHPSQAVWSAPLPAPKSDSETARSVGIYRPGYDGPPEHYHEHSVEHFEILSGEATFAINDRVEHVTAGETVTVETGERHTFSVGGDDLCYMLVEIRSPGRLRYVLPTLGGLAHDDEMTLSDPLQQAAIAQRLDGNTEFTELDPVVGRPLRSVLAPLARLGTYRGAYDKYTRDAFWERKVEQPEL